MRTSTVLRNTLLAFGLLIGAAASHADTLDLSEGTMTTGGRAGLFLAPTPINSIKGGNFGYAIDLTFGYFIFDNFEIDAKVGSQGLFSNPVTGLGFNVGLGARYNFDLGSMIYPYIGVLPEFVWVKDGNQNWQFNLPVSLGILASLNSHVALDFGVTAGLGWGLYKGASSTPNLSAGLGYMGVRAFF